MFWQEIETNMTSLLSQTLAPLFALSPKDQPLISGRSYLITVQLLVGVALIAAFLGIFTNVINILTFITMGVEDGVTALFLAMACSDLAFVVLTCIRNVVIILYTLEKDGITWLSIHPVAIAYFSDNAAFTAYTMTALTSTFLAVARCMCVAKPLQFKNMFTRRRCLVALTLCFLFPVACQTAVFANMGMTERFDASKNASRLMLWFSADREKIKDVVRLILSSVVPLSSQVIVIVCVAVMTAKLKESAHFRKGRVQNGDDLEKRSRDTKLEGKDRQVVLQVVLISIIYIISNIPKIANSICSLAEPRLDAGKAFNNLYEIMSDVQSVFESVNASVNFFVYITFNQTFRSACYVLKKHI